MKDYKGIEIYQSYDNNNIIICYDQFTFENKYKIYKKNECDYYSYIYSTDGIIQATNYVKMMRGGKLSYE